MERLPRQMEGLPRQMDPLLQHLRSTGSQSSSSSTSSTQKHLAGISKIQITDEGLETQMFVDKYKPKTSKDIVGQTGDRSNVVKLTNWLKSWHENREKEKSGAKDKKGNRYGNDDGSTFKAVLLVRSSWHWKDYFSSIDLSGGRVCLQGT